MKKFLSILLSICLVMSCSVCAFAASPAETVKVAKEHPVVIVRGMDFSTGLMYDRGTENEKYVHMEVSAGGVINTLAKALGAYFTNFRGQESVEVICDYVAEILAGYACDGNGDSVYKNITSEKFPEAVENYGRFNVHSGVGEEGLANALLDRYGEKKVYYYVYDWRLDPWDTCDGLEELIIKATKENGTDRADIICCSMGGSVAMAYMAKYGYDKINTLISNTSVMGGTDVVTDLFLGKAYFEPLAVENKLSAAVPGMKGLIKLLSKTGILDKLCGAVNGFVEKYKDTVYELSLVPTLATLPGYWSTVKGEKYFECRDYVFGDKQEEFAGLLKRTDRLYNEVMSKRDVLVNDALAAGVKICILANYNTPLICAYERASYQGDGVLDTRTMAMGATVSKVTKILSDEELNMGNAKYVSPDKCINASTCTLPDYTWFGKDAGHVVGNYGSEYTDFVFALLESDAQPTIDTWEQYPQFLQSDYEEHLSPVTAEGKDDNEQNFFPC